MRQQSWKISGAPELLSKELEHVLNPLNPYLSCKIYPAQNTTEKCFGLITEILLTVAH